MALCKHANAKQTVPAAITIQVRNIHGSENIRYRNSRGNSEGVAEAQKRIAEHLPTAAVALLDRPADEADRPNPNYKCVSFDVAVTSAQE